MNNFKCLSCQGDLDLNTAVNGTVICKKCGCVFLVPVRNLQDENVVEVGEVIKKTVVGDKPDVAERLHIYYADKISGSTATVGSIIIRARQFFEDGDNNSAANYYNRVLDIDPHNVEAWWGLFLIDFNVKSEKSLIDRLNTRLYDDILKNRNYNNAAKYADDRQVKALAEFKKALQSSEFWWNEFLCEQNVDDESELLENFRDKVVSVCKSKNFCFACQFADGEMKDRIEEFLDEACEDIDDAKRMSNNEINFLESALNNIICERSKAEKDKALLENEQRGLKRKYLSRSGSVKTPFWITFGVVAVAGVIAWFITLLVLGFQHDLIKWDLKDVTPELIGATGLPGFLSWCYHNGILMIIVEALLYGVITGFVGALLLLFTAFLPRYKSCMKKNARFNSKYEELKESKLKVSNLNAQIDAVRAKIEDLRKKIRVYDVFLKTFNFKGYDEYDESYTYDGNGWRRDY